MSESYFSIVTAFDAFGLDATTTISRSLDSKVTEFSVEDGGFASDNIVNYGDSITMRGIISSVNANGLDQHPSSFIAEIERIRLAKELVKINVGLDTVTQGGTKTYKSITSCAIVSATFTQDKKHGITKAGDVAYNVNIRFKKVRIIDKPSISVKTVSIKVKDAVVEVAPAPEDKVTSNRVGNIGEVNKDTGAFTRFDFTSEDPSLNPTLRE